MVTVVLLLVVGLSAADDPKKVPLDKSDEHEFVGWVFSTDGRRVAARWGNEEKGGVGVWDTATGKRVAAVDAGDSIAAVGISPDGKYVAAGCGRRYSDKAFVWEVANGKQTTLEGMTASEGYSQPVFSADNTQLAIGSDGHGYVWNLTAAKPSKVDLGECQDAVQLAGFSPDGKRVLGSMWSGILGGGNFLGGPKRDLRRVVVWDATTGKEITRREDGVKLFMTAAAFSPDGKSVASVVETEKSGKRTQIHLWDAASGKTQAELDSAGVDETALVTTLRYTADGSGVLYSLFPQNVIGRWDHEAKTTRTLVGGKEPEILLELADSFILTAHVADSELLIVPVPMNAKKDTEPKTITTLIRAKVPAKKK